MWTLSGVQRGGSLLPDRGFLCLDFGIYSLHGSQQAPRKKHTYSKRIPIFLLPSKTTAHNQGIKTKTRSWGSVFIYFFAGHTGTFPWWRNLLALGDRAQLPLQTLKGIKCLVFKRMCFPHFWKCFPAGGVLWDFLEFSALGTWKGACVAVLTPFNLSFHFG